MRKLILLISILFVGLVAFGQSKPTEVTPDGYIFEPAYQYIWGSSADTLTSADTISFVYRIKGVKTLDINAQLYVDFVAGNPTDTLFSYYSIDGVNYSPDDTLAMSPTADGMESTVLSFSDFMFPYLKFEIRQATGSEDKVVPKLYIYAKEN